MCTTTKEKAYKIKALEFTRKEGGKYGERYICVSTFGTYVVNYFESEERFVWTYCSHGGASSSEDCESFIQGMELCNKHLIERLSVLLEEIEVKIGCTNLNRKGLRDDESIHSKEELV